MLNFAIQTARDAGRVLAEKFGRAIQITNKGDIDLVTEADLAAERLIIERIRSHHPRHSILSEEAGDVIAIEGEQSEYKWIVDPLDGTTNYVARLLAQYRVARVVASDALDDEAL